MADIRPEPVVRSFAPPGIARYRVLDEILRQGALTVDGEDSSHCVTLRKLCDAGLVYRLFAPPSAPRTRSTYAITEWGRIVWWQERRRAARLDADRR